MRPPCDEAVIRAAGVPVPCGTKDRSWILIGTILASSMAFIDSTVVNVALPAIQTIFHATMTDMQWVVESYGLCLGALILVGGSLGDLLGRRLIFLLGVAIFAVSSAGCGVALNIHQLIVARSVQGLGAAFLVPGSLAIISTSFDEKGRGKAIGTWSGFTAITAATGPVLGGFLVEHGSWRLAFFINLPIAAAVIAITIWRIPETRSIKAIRVDWAGAILATLGLGGVVTGFIESSNLGWGNPLVFGSLIAGFGCIFAFVSIERRATSPMVPLTLFESSCFSGANLLTLFLYAAIGIFFFLLPLNLIQVQGYSATASGAAVFPLILLIFLLSRWSGGLVARYGARWPLVAGPLIVALGFTLFALPTVGNSYWKVYLPSLLVLGFGMAVTVAPLTTVVMSSVGRDWVGTASGINNAIARVAGVLAIAILGIVMVQAFASRLNNTLLRLSLPPGVLQQVQAEEIKLAGLSVPTGLNPSTRAALQKSIHEAFVFGFRTIILICACLSLASAVVAWLMIPRAPSASNTNNIGTGAAD